MTERDSDEMRAEDTGAGADEQSRPKRFQKRVEDVLRGLQDEAQQAAPQVLDELSATAKSVAQYLDDMATKARGKQAKDSPAPDADDAGAAPPEIDRSRPSE